MSLLWLRFALGCYFIGLVYAFVALTRTSDLFSRIALHAASLGMVFHFVSLTELFLVGPGRLGIGAQRRIAAGVSVDGVLHGHLRDLPDDFARRGRVSRWSFS